MGYLTASSLSPRNTITMSRTTAINELEDVKNIDEEILNALKTPVLELMIRGLDDYANCNVVIAEAGESVKQLFVTVKSVYGRKRIYPTCQISQIFAEIAGTQTLSDRDIKSIEKLGYEVQTLNPEL